MKTLQNAAVRARARARGLRGPRRTVLNSRRSLPRINDRERRRGERTSGPAADAAAYFLYTVASLAYNVLKITPLFILLVSLPPSSLSSSLLLSLSLSPSLYLTVPRDHRRLPPLSVLRSLPAFKLLRPGSRRTRQNDREIFRNAQHPGLLSRRGAPACAFSA